GGFAGLGLAWQGRVMRQSDRRPPSASAVDRLWQDDLLYPCTCTRRDIDAALAAPQEGVPVAGPDGPAYPGTCRGKHCGALPCSMSPRPTETHLRLDMGNASGRLCHRSDSA